MDACTRRGRPRAPPPLLLVFRVLPLLLAAAYLPAGAQGMPRRKYLCPPDFVRHGNSCYYFSTHMATWFDAHFDCKDRSSELAIMEKGWEDRNMRTYLNKPELARLERWIGGIYNWEIKRWVWGANGGNPLKYQGFSQMAKNSEPKWNCIVMDPHMNYKWGSRLCIDKKHYICEKPLKRVKPPQPHMTELIKPKKNRDPNKPKKPRDPSKRPLNQTKLQRQQRRKWRQRQLMRQQQQRMNTKPPPVSTTQTPSQQSQAEPLHNQPPRSQQLWGGQGSHHHYRFVQIQPEIIPYREEVLI